MPDETPPATAQPGADRPEAARPEAPGPEAMRRAMADYVRTVHQAYLSQAKLQPPAVQGRMPLLAESFTVVAAGVRNLHVIATTETLPHPAGPEVAIDDELDAGDVNLIVG